MLSGPPIYTQWKNNTASSWWKDPGLRFNTICCGILFLGVVVNGYDGSYLTGLQALQTWKTYFGSPKGTTLGLISAAAYFPTFIAPPILSYLCDTYGRKSTILFGATIVCIGAFIAGFAQNRGMLIGGRVVVGFGNIFLTVACICLCQELTHPRLRGITTALLHTLYYAGSLTAALLTFGLSYAQAPLGNWSWRIPTILQCAAPVVLIASMIFVPESPRFLIAKGQEDQAHVTLARLHSNGKMDDELVVNEFNEMRAAIKLEQTVSTGWSSLVKTPGNRRRLLVIIIIATGTQWLGQGILSYYLAPVLKTVGITKAEQVTGFNVGLSVWNWIIATIGACSVDRIGRRALWLFGTAWFFLAYCGFMACSAIYATKGSEGAGRGAMAFVFLVFAGYNMTWNPLSYSYTAEILPYSIRAKGVSIFSFTQSASLALNQFANPIALDALAWKYYGVYVAVSACYIVLIFFLFPETKGYTAEEVGRLFDKDQNFRPDEVLSEEDQKSESKHSVSERERIEM